MRKTYGKTGRDVAVPNGQLRIYLQPGQGGPKRQDSKRNPLRGIARELALPHLRSQQKGLQAFGRNRLRAESVELGAGKQTIIRFVSPQLNILRIQ